MGVSIDALFQAPERLDGRGANCWRQTEEHRDRHRQRDAERDRAPVGIEYQLEWFSEIDERDDEWRRPPSEERAGRRGTHSKQEALDEDQLNQSPPPGADRHA